MKILAVADMQGISNNGKFRIETLCRAFGGENVDVVDSGKNPITISYRIKNKFFSMGLPIHIPDLCGENRKVCEYVSKNSYDLIWVEKVLTLRRETLEFIHTRLPDAKIVNCTSDNMVMRHNQSQNFLDCIPLYDAHITTKSYILEEFRNLGAKRVIFTRKCYEDTFHYPREISDEDRKRLGGEVGFIGAWEAERMESILYLTRNGISVRVFGNKKWQVCKGDNENLVIEDGGLYDEDYVKAICAFSINLCFLRKINYDLQTDRSMEIPACGGFMLAERTEEHRALFEEDKEAVYFSSNEELLRKCRFYLSHMEEREQIARAGYRRCTSSGYSNIATYPEIVKNIMREGQFKEMRE